MTTANPYDTVKVVLLGIAQDGGVPQAGCSCKRCMSVHNGDTPELYPVSLGITDKDGGFHLIEASRTISRQLFIWAKALQEFGFENDVVNKVDSISLTHLHLGHIDGLGIFGREVMGYDNGSVKLIASSAVIQQLKSRSLLAPFRTESIHNKNEILLGKGVSIEFHRVPHREIECCGDTHGIVIRGEQKSILFLPDHDTYNETLQWQKMSSLRQWFKHLCVDIVLIDGTFYSTDEVSCQRKDASDIPHPSIENSLQLLGKKRDDDPELTFIHLNHTNSVIDDSIKAAGVADMGWKLGKQGHVFQI